MNSSLGPVLDRRNLGATGFGRTVLIKGCVLWQFKGSKRKPMGDQGETKGEKAEGVHLKWKSTQPQLEAPGPAKTGPQVGRAATTTSRWWSKASRTLRTRTPSPSTSAPAARRGETVRARAALTRARGWRARTAGKLQVQRSFGGSKHGNPQNGKPVGKTRTWGWFRLCNFQPHIFSSPVFSREKRGLPN